MSLREELMELTNLQGKLSFEQIKDKLKEAAIQGKVSLYINSDEITKETINELKCEGLGISYIDGRIFNHYYINWGTK